VVDKLYLSYSALSAYRHCPKRYYWKYVRRLEESQEAPALRIGRVVHDVLGNLYSGLTLEQALPPAQTLSEDERLLIASMCRGYVETWYGGEVPPEVVDSSQTAKRFWIDMSVPEYEATKVRFGGRVDLISPADLLDMPGEGVVAVEHKTTSLKRPEMAARLHEDDQLLLYAHVLGRTGSVPAHGIYDVIRTRIPRRPSTNADGSLNRSFYDTTPEIYWEVMLATECTGAPWSMHLEKLKQRGQQFHYRLDVELSERTLELAWAGARQTAKEICDSISEGHWQKYDRDRCYSYRGPCPYLELCKADSDPSDEEMGRHGFVRGAGVADDDAETTQQSSAVREAETASVPTTVSRSPALQGEKATGAWSVPALTSVDVPQFSSGDIGLFVAVAEKLLTGGRVLLTGAAGTGKTYFVKKLVLLLAKMGRVTYLTASTGLGASQMNDDLMEVFPDCIRGPTTLHSAASIPPTDEPDNRNAIFRGRGQLEDVDVLVIDEVSMLDRLTFNRLMRRMPRVTSILAVGDFFQLPPVREDRYGNPEFVFRSQHFASFIAVELTKVHRQQDLVFIGFLHRVRSGEDCQRFYSFLSPDFDPGYPVFFGTNREVNLHNKKEISKLKSPSLFCNCMVAFGNEGEALAWLEERTRALTELEVKVGMRVLCIQNLHTDGLVNGDVGTVTDVDEGGGRGHGPEWMDVEFDRVGLRKMVRHEFEKVRWKRREKVKELVVLQFPLVPAYGLTVHKSQGMTLDCANIDGRRVDFAAGQVYVALSRCRTREGLRVRNSHGFRVFAHPEVIEYYMRVSRLDEEEIRRYRDRANVQVIPPKLLGAVASYEED